VLLPSAPWDVVYFAEQMESEKKIMQSAVRSKHIYMQILKETKVYATF
jgi:hypothetical protein